MTGGSASATQPLTARVQRAVDGGKVYLPALPELVSRMMELLEEDARSSTKEVAELIHNEPAVAATLLRMANSVAFGGLHPISELSQGIARLGLRQVASVVTAHAHSGHFDSDDPTKKALLESLWAHAVAAGLAAKRLAGITGGEPEESFLAGLLHDCGKLLVLKAVDFLESGPDPVTVTPVVLGELMDLMHAELGHRTLSEWRIPDPVSRAVLHHHDEEVPAEEALVLRVQVADAMARKIGAHPSPDPRLELLDMDCVEQLGLSDIELAALMVDLEDEVEEVKKLV